jgi:Pyruvate/2-oxoacid:ferredoxin oxidoreductase delta subunit
LKRKIIDIYFFTGTGNTYLAAKKIVEVFYKEKYIVTLSDIVESNSKEINLSNTIGIGFPVICWNTFPIVKNFINSMPKSNGTEIFVFTTMGNTSLNTAANYGNILKIKGYSLIGTCDFLMPNNFIAIQKEEKNILKREKAYVGIEHYTKELINGIIKKEKKNLLFKICFIISSFITNIWYRNLFQKIIKFNIIRSKCNKCGFCAKICPVKNISFEYKYPVFNGKRCQICMRCISYCPSSAIRFFFKKKTYKALTIREVEKWFVRNF